MRLLINFFQPSFKLKEKHRDGARVVKRYHRPATPYQRLLYDARTPEDARIRLKAMYLTLDPVRLLRDIRLAQERLVDTADKPDGSGAAGGEALPLERLSVRVANCVAWWGSKPDRLPQAGGQARAAQTRSSPCCHCRA